jgi:hypothetical protein
LCGLKGARLEYLIGGGVCCLVACFLLYGAVFSLFAALFRNGAVARKLRIEEAAKNGMAANDSLKQQLTTVQGILASYSAHEARVFSDVVEKRKADSAVLLALAEAHPELKGNRQFEDAIRQVERIQREVVRYQLAFNGAVRDYNEYIDTWPNRIFINGVEFPKF